MVGLYSPLAVYHINVHSPDLKALRTYETGYWVGCTFNIMDVSSSLMSRPRFFRPARSDSDMTFALFWGDNLGEQNEVRMGMRR